MLRQNWRLNMHKPRKGYTTTVEHAFVYCLDTLHYSYVDVHKLPIQSCQE